MIGHPQVVQCLGRFLFTPRRRRGSPADRGIPAAERGLPALYVSGYLAAETTSATHAWLEVCIPKIGWRGLDPTHNREADEKYVKIAVGCDYADVPPLTGHYLGTLERRLEVDVKIQPVP